MGTLDQSVVEVPELVTTETRDDSYAACIRAGDWVFVSGITGVGRDGAVVASEFTPQAEQAFANISRALEAARSSLDDVYYMVVWLRDMRLIDEFYAVCRDYLGETRLPMTIIGGSNLIDPEARVQLEARALASNSSIERRLLDGPGVPDGHPPAENIAAGVEVGEFVFLSGKQGVDEGNELVSLDFDQQMRQVLMNVKAGLEAGNSSTEHMLATTTWMRDHRDKRAFHERRSEILGTDVSTSTRVAISELSDPRSLVEMEAIGVKSEFGKEMVDHPEELPLATMERDGETYPRFWQCVAAGDWVFTSGMVGVDADFNTVSKAFEPQARKVLENVELALESAGTNIGDLVYTRTHLTDMRYVDEFLSMRSEVWGATRATSSIIHSPSLAERDFRVEVEAIALKPS